MQNFLFDIPKEFFDSSPLYEDVTVIIGENGSGKSTLLNELMKDYSRYREKVLAIANSIHDKFVNTSGNTYILRGRQGRRQTKQIIKSAFQNLAKDNITRFSYVSRVLEYLSFEPRIGFKVSRINFNDYEYKINKEFHLDEDRNELLFLVERLKREYDDSYHYHNRTNKIIWLDVSRFNFEVLEKSSLTKLFLWESKLKKMKILSSIEVFLSRNGHDISLFDASSGELTLLTTLVFLATIIDERTVILIDEPENSLHPKWQRQYIKNILDIFHLFQPKIIIATHSPIIVNGAEIEVQNPKIFKATNFKLELQKNEPKNIEQLYFELFGITTPENRYISNVIIEKINEYSENKITRIVLDIFLNSIKSSMYQDSQKEVINSLFKIVDKIKQS